MALTRAAVTAGTPVMAATPHVPLKHPIVPLEVVTRGELAPGGGRTHLGP
jgi:hypothetical protein